MTENDDAEVGSPSDVPTFGDLVEELEDRRPAGDERATGGDADGAAAEGAATEEDRGGLQSIDGIGPAYSDRLQDAGIDDVPGLATASPAHLAGAIDVPEATVAGWVEQAETRLAAGGAPTDDGEAEIDRGDRRLPSDLDALFDLVGEPTNVLLVGPRGTPDEYDVCARILDRAAGTPRRRLLVTTEQSPKERLGVLRGYGAGSFEETVVVALGDHPRSTDDLGAVDDDAVTVERVTDPGDLTRLGLVINKYLTGPEDEPGPVFCFHNLSDLSRAVELERLFRFLHVLMFRLEGAVSSAHYHIDPAEHSAEDLEVIAELFDFTVRLSDEGDVTVEP